MSGVEIAAEVAAGLAESGAELGDGAAHQVTIVRAGATTGDAYAPTPGTPTDHSVTAVFSRWAARHIDGTLIRQGDRKLLIEAAGFVPALGDVVKDAGGTEIGTIVEPLSRVRPAGVDVLYVANVRG